MTSTKQTSRLGSPPFILLLALAAASCAEDSGVSSDPGDEPPIRAEVLASLGERVVVPAQVTFATRAASLEAALASAAAGGSRAEAQEAWRAAVDSWQWLEMMQVGPAGSSLNVMGGQDLRARIYTWPTLDTCLIDQTTVGDEFDDPDVLDASPGTPRGLGAIEYLLFNDDPENTCTAFRPIEPAGIWETLSAEIPGRRLAYAAALATLVRRSADDLVEAWAPEGADFISELTDPRRGGAVYGSAQEGLNAISDAMFYLDKEAKDMKLAEPAGITGCAQARCPDAIESRWAFQSKEHLLTNLRAFQALFLGATPGTDAPGFDDLLDDMGSSAVTSEMTEAIASALTALEAIPGALSEAIETDPQAVEDAHEAVRVVTDILKTNFIGDLDLEAPDRAAGDND